MPFDATNVRILQCKARIVNVSPVHLHPSLQHQLKRWPPFSHLLLVLLTQATTTKRYSCNAAATHIASRCEWRLPAGDFANYQLGCALLFGVFFFSIFKRSNGLQVTFLHPSIFSRFSCHKDFTRLLISSRW